MNVYEYCAIEDVSDCLEILLKNNMLGINDLFSLMDYTIYCNSRKTFNLTINTLKKCLNTNDKSTEEKIYNALEKMINLFRFSFIFKIFNDEQLVMIYESIIFTEEIMIKLILMVEIFNKQIEGKNNKPKFNEILTILINFESLNKNNTKIKENIDKILYDYKAIFKKKNERIPLSFMKTLISLNMKEIFFQCYEHNVTLGFPNNEIDITINKNNYVLKIVKCKKVDVRNVSFYWTDMINNINCFNILFHSLINENDEYSSSILKNEYFDKFFFEKSKENQTVLHILFSIENLFKFRQVFTKFELLCEKFDYNKFEKINELLNESDSELLLPIDTALKKKNFKVIEEYSEYINSKKILI